MLNETSYFHRGFLGWVVFVVFVSFVLVGWFFCLVSWGRFFVWFFFTYRDGKNLLVVLPFSRKMQDIGAYPIHTVHMGCPKLLLK